MMRPVGRASGDYSLRSSSFSCFGRWLRVISQATQRIVGESVPLTRPGYESPRVSPLCARRQSQSHHAPPKTRATAPAMMPSALPLIAPRTISIGPETTMPVVLRFSQKANRKKPMHNHTSHHGAYLCAAPDALAPESPKDGDEDQNDETADTSVEQICHMTECK